VARALPAVTEENEYFWRSGESGTLQIMRCNDCGYWLHPPGPVCRRCRSRSMAPQPVSGLGTVSRFTVNHQQWRPDLEVPYVVASVELDEQPGLFVTTNIVGCEPGEVRSGMRVAVGFEQIEDVWIPVFAPELSNDDRAKEHVA